MVSVCILSTVHGPTNTRVFHKEAKTAVAEGYDVTYVVHEPPGTHDSGVMYRSLGTAENRLERWSHIPRAYRLACDIDADIYHCHDPELLPVGLRLKQTTDGAVIYDAHEDYGYNAINQREWIPAPLRPPLTMAFPKIQSTFANYLDAVVTPTDSIADQFQEYGHNRVQVVHNFPKTDGISIGDCSVSRDHEYQLVYVGRLSKTRGLKAMLRLVRALREFGYDVGLWTLGTFGSDDGKRWATEYVETHDIAEAVRFLGFIPYEEIFSYLHAADIGLCLVDEQICEHGLPTKIFEYMYASTPVLATDAQLTRQYVDDDTGRLVSQPDVIEQSTAIREMCSDEATLLEMGTTGRSRVQKRYNWEHEAETLRALYKEVMNS